MLPHEDVQFQLVDLPPVSDDYIESWMGGTLQNADAVLLVSDLSDPECVDQLEAVERQLQAKKVDLVARVPGREDALLTVSSDAASGSAGDQIDDPFRLRLPALLVASKADLYEDPDAELEAFRELAQDPFVSLAVSTQTEQGLDKIGPTLFELLEVVRVYSKMPGRTPDMSKPFTLRRDRTVREVARQVHRGLASDLRFARVWGPSAEFDGQRVSGDHAVKDKDVIELHWQAPGSPAPRQ